MPTGELQSTNGQARYVVVAPTFNHAGLLRGVLDAIPAIGLPIVVVDDGSRDDTASTLEEWRTKDPGSRFVVTHGDNRGKAEALRSGFHDAEQRGFTHALTIDTDGQHNPADAAALLRSRMIIRTLSSSARGRDGSPGTRRRGVWAGPCRITLSGLPAAHVWTTVSRVCGCTRWPSSSASMCAPGGMPSRPRS